MDLEAAVHQTHGDAPEHSRIHSCAKRHVFEQLATEAQELATWAEHHRQESSDYFKRIRDNSIEEIDATRPAAHPKQEPYVALALRAALREHIRKSTLNEL